MEHTTTELFKLLFSDPSTFFTIIKQKAADLIISIRQLLEPYNQDLLWIVPSILCALIFFYLTVKLIMKKRRNRTPKDSRPVVIAEHAEPEHIEETLSSESDSDTQTEFKAPELNEEKPVGLLTNIKTGLSKTRKVLSSSVDKLFLGGGQLDDEMLEELEELLITSDVGVKTSLQLIENLSAKSSVISNSEDLKKALKEEIYNFINVQEKAPATISKPHVMMVVGVNGVGKTTTIGKLAFRFVREGKKVLIVAADTFRAAASDQLAVWAERSGADIVRHKDNSDPAAVAFDGIEAAIARKVDIVIIDTAGRLHTKKNLMEELKKIERTVSGKIPDAPHETLMVVDATTGQNALQQAQLFNEAVGIDSIALTKLDGTAKGGIVIGITNTLNVQLKYIGIGEQVEDLQDFDSKEFADAIL